MRFLGLHPLDWGVIALYIVVLVVVALWARRRVRTASDFYQGNRSFGRILVAFLNFGNMTDAGQTASVTREVYRQGLSGVWFQNVVLFHTPFQWFIAPLQRRARYIGPADLYLHRFQSRFLAGLYAAVILFVALYANAQGYLLTGKTLQAMMIKPAAELTLAERSMVEGYQELAALRPRPDSTLTLAERERRDLLAIRLEKGEIAPFVSYLDLPTFYALYALVIMLYTAIGGLFAIAIIDVIQGILILFLSIAVIPSALGAVGGLTGLREKVDPSFFDVFGTSATSEYTWYFVASFALLNLVVNAPKSFTLGGSPKDDRSARIGMVGGAITKRLMMVGWAFTGLLALGLYSGSVADPTNIWGFMTRDLLGIGALGLMVAAIFSANMDGNATISLDASAAVVKNIYEPLFGQASARREVLIGRGVVLITLALAIPLALWIDDIVVVFKYVLSVGTIVGPSFWLAYFWRRLNTRAVAIQMILTILLTIVLPNVVPMTGLTRDPALTAQTAERVVEVERRAGRADVAAGRATRVGDLYVATERVPPTPIYFERLETSVAGSTPSITHVGAGLFRPEIWILSKLGIDFSDWRRSGILTASSLFNAIFPFVVLIVASYFTRRNSPEVLDDFYARIHTPAAADPEEDARLVREKIEHPELVEQDKLFPHTDWEFWKPTRFDILGFLACIAFVLVIILLYIWVGSLGA